MEPQDAGAASVKIRHGEHLAADIAVARPIDQVVAPIDRLLNMRKAETELADGFVIHGINSPVSRGLPVSAGRLRMGLQAPEALGIRPIEPDCA